MSNVFLDQFQTEHKIPNYNEMLSQWRQQIITKILQLITKPFVIISFEFLFGDGINKEQIENCKLSWNIIVFRTGSAELEISVRIYKPPD